MKKLLWCAGVAVLAVAVATGVGAQGQESTAKESTAKAQTSPLELTGCVSASPGASGDFTFVDGESGNSYLLKGKNIRKYAGQRVTVTGSQSNKKVAVKLGLWPSPNIAAQAGALDPQQESVARQPGGAASGVETKLPELRVARLRVAEGACR
jgi:hypothetical protein